MVKTLQAEIDEHELNGWEVAERKPTMVVMKKRSIGSLWVHLILLLTFGIGNMIYAAWRLLKPKKKVLKGEPMEGQRERNKEAREKGKNAREASRFVRKFF